MTMPDLPAEAIQAAHEATSCRLGEPGWTDLLYKSPRQLIDIALAAAAPVIAAQAAAAEHELTQRAFALLNEAHVLAACGENAPGGDETWGAWERKLREFADLLRQEGDTP